MIEKVKLEGIVKGHDILKKPAWHVTLGYYPSSDYKEPVLTANFAIPTADFDEEHIVKIARNYFHNLCSRLGTESAPWDLGEGGVEALKRGK